MSDFHLPRWAGVGWICGCGATGNTSQECAQHVERQRRAKDLPPNLDVEVGL